MRGTLMAKVRSRGRKAAGQDGPEVVSDNPPIAADRAISETASENPPKRKRGRPRTFTAAAESFHRGLWCGIKTGRGLANKMYQSRALQILGYAEPFHWLTSTEQEIGKGEGLMRFTLLSELGRIESSQDMQAAALELCRLKPRTKEGVAMIRGWRGKRRRVGAIDLTKAIIRMVNSYLDAHPEITLAMVLAALENAGQAFTDANESKG